MTPAVRERGILMSAPMVRALLDGTKTQTRRVVTVPLWEPLQERAMAPGCGIWRHADGQREVRCPYGRPGDRLWVKHAADLFPVYFKPILGWEDRYAVGTDGLIYRTDRGQPEPLSGSPSSKGYLTVSLSRGDWETKAVHKLVCETFYGAAPFDGAQVRHVDGDQTNNRPENLDWGTAEQNWQDRKAHGGGMGQSHHAAKLTAAQVAEIRASSLSQRTLAKMHGVSQSTIGAVRTGETWGEHEPAPRNTPVFRLWRSPLFCPRWASRLTLELTDVRVERVQDISEADILAEGVNCRLAAERTGIPWSSLPTLHHAWRAVWDQLNAKRGYGWDANPFVWVLTFRRITP